MNNQELSGVPCLNTRRGLTPLFQLHRDPEIVVRNGENPEVPASTRDDVLFIRAGMYEESRGAPYNDKGDLTSLRRHERVLQVDMQLERTPKLPDRTPPNSRNSPLHD